MGGEEWRRRRRKKSNKNEKKSATRRRRSFHISGHTAAAKKSVGTFFKYKILLTVMRFVKVDPLMVKYLYSLIGGPIFDGLVEIIGEKPAYTSQQFVESDDKVVKQSMALRQYHRIENDHK